MTQEAKTETKTDLRRNWINDEFPPIVEAPETLVAELRAAPKELRSRVLSKIWERYALCLLEPHHLQWKKRSDARILRSPLTGLVLECRGDQWWISAGPRLGQTLLTGGLDQDDEGTVIEALVRFALILSGLRRKSLR